MKKISCVLATIAALCFSQVAEAQTNVQMFYDFGKERSYVTATLEGFYTDKGGDTFFFSDFYFSNQKNVYGASNGVYFEVERGLNFWHDSALKDFSAHIEYDGATWGASMACIGAKYQFHNDDFSRFFTIYLMYDFMFGQEASVPLKVSGVWAVNNLFGAKWLTFKGFFDFWGLDNQWGPSDINSGSADTKWTFLAEPQLWFKVAEHLDLGTEIECSVNFAGHKGFMCNPCIGARWTF